MRSLKTLILTVCLVSALPAFGAIYMKIEGVPGDSKAAGKDKWIEIQSVAQATGEPLATTGMLSSGRVRVSSSSSAFPAQLDRLCKAKLPLGQVLLEVDGRLLRLENTRSAECPTTLGATQTMVLVFGADKGTAATQRGNASISGLDRLPLSMDIRRASITGNVATVALKAGTLSQSLGKAIQEATLKGTFFPVLTIEASGQKWSFMKVLFTSTQFSPDQDFIFTFQFESMNGSAAAFQALGQ